MKLTDFLRQAAGAPHRFGQWDCAMTLANWLAACTGQDPAAHLRGRYSTAFGWQRIAKRAGGLATLVGRLAAQAGLSATDEPQPGDIGVVDWPGIGQAGAIRVPRGWAVKFDDGLTVADVPMVAAWKV